MSATQLNSAPRSHSGAISAWRCTLFPPVSSQSQFKARNERNYLDSTNSTRAFSAIRRVLAIVFKKFCQAKSVGAYHPCHHSAVNSHEGWDIIHACGRTTLFFKNWIFTASVCLIFFGIACVGEASVPGFHIPMKVIVNVCYCGAKAKKTEPVERHETGSLSDSFEQCRWRVVMVPCLQKKRTKHGALGIRIFPDMIRMNIGWSWYSQLAFGVSLEPDRPPLITCCQALWYGLALEAARNACGASFLPGTGRMWEETGNS